MKRSRRVTVLVLSCALAAGGATLMAAAATSGVGATPTCPSVGGGSGCAYVLTVNPNGSVSISAGANTASYDGGTRGEGDDAVVGVVNNSNAIVSSIALAGTSNVFGFDGDGLCTQSFTSPVSSSYCQTNGPNGGPSFTTAVRGRTTGDQPLRLPGSEQHLHEHHDERADSELRDDQVHDGPSATGNHLPVTRGASHEDHRDSDAPNGPEGRRAGVGLPAARGHALERPGHHVHRPGIDFAGQRVHGPDQLGRRQLERRDRVGVIGLLRREREPHLRRRGDRQSDRDGHRSPLAGVHRQQRRLRHLGLPGPSLSPTRR